MSNTIFESIADNALSAAQFAVIIIATFVVAWIFEKIAKKRNNDTERILTTRKIVVIGVFAAIATILHIMDFPVLFAPAFYQMDFSELPALIGGFAFGPVAGVMIEFVKILLKLVIKGTSTAFVGDLANFVIGSSFVLTASVIYDLKKSKKSAIIACVAGTLAITIVGTLFNAVYLLPKFAEMYGMPIDALIAMGTAINPSVNSIFSFVVICVAPMNLLKGGVDSLITMLVYKKLSPIIKNANLTKTQKQPADSKI